MYILETKNRGYSIHGNIIPTTYHGYIMRINEINGEIEQFFGLSQEIMDDSICDILIYSMYNLRIYAVLSYNIYIYILHSIPRNHTRGFVPCGSYHSNTMASVASVASRQYAYHSQTATWRRDGRNGQGNPQKGAGIEMGNLRCGIEHFFKPSLKFI